MGFGVVIGFGTAGRGFRSVRRRRFRGPQQCIDLVDYFRKRGVSGGEREEQEVGFISPAVFHVGRACGGAVEVFSDGFVWRHVALRLRRVAQ